MSVLIILGQKCTLAASRAVPGESACSFKVRKKIGQTDGRTDGRQNDAQRLPLDAASVIFFNVYCPYLFEHFLFTESNYSIGSINPLY